MYIYRLISFIMCGQVERFWHMYMCMYSYGNVKESILLVYVCVCVYMGITVSTHVLRMEVSMYVHVCMHACTCTCILIIGMYQCAV